MKSFSELGISPCPWRLQTRKTNLGRTVVSIDASCGEKVMDEYIDDENGSVEADLRLFAAAPEMAKVCYDLITWDGNLDAKFLKIIDDAKMAYAKASGEESK